MSRRVIIAIVCLCLLVSLPLLAEDELMTKLYFNNWLNKTTTPLSGRIAQLQNTLTELERQTNEIKRSVITEIKVVIASKKAEIDGKTVSLDVPPLINNNRTMVPVRFIGEAFGAQFDWDSDLRKVTYSLDDTIIEVFIDKTTAVCNGKTLNLDAPPIIVDGRTMVPIRFVSEQMAAQVGWDGNKREVTVIR